MRRVISSYILSPETKAFILFQQHKCTETADQTAENVTLGHPCCKNSADVLGRGTQALPHSHAFGCSIAVKLAGLWHWVAVHRQSFWCSEMAILHPCPPREAGAQVPNRCTVWPWHCGDCCCPPTLGTRNQQVHQLLPHQPHCRETNEPQGKCGFSPSKKTISSSNFSGACFTFPAEQTQCRCNPVEFFWFCTPTLTTSLSKMALFALAIEVTNYAACLTWQLFTRKLHCLYIFAAVNKLS